MTVSYDLPESLEIGGKIYAIRSGYRAALDICAALSDAELNGQEKAYMAMWIFYPEFDDMPPEYYKEALDKLVWFINGGTEADKKKPKQPRVMDWAQDFNLIVGPINRVLGYEIRKKTGPDDDGVHWWTLLSAYTEIGDCTFAQVVRIRDRKARGKPLDKQDREWYRRNRDLVDFKKEYSTAEKDLLKEWGGI